MHKTLCALDRTIVAFDQMTEKEIFDFLKCNQGKIKYAKIGMEAFFRYGPQLVNTIDRLFSGDDKIKIFLDLKLHDIPVTVQKALKTLQKLPVTFLTIHLTGGEKMIEMALQQLRNCENKQLQLLGVTFLTSLGEEDFKDIWNIPPNKVQQCFQNMVEIAHRTQLPGLILSAHELKWLKQTPLAKKKIQAICPGIRFSDEISQKDFNDQKRVATPQMAFAQGADYIVVGRSLTQSDRPGERLQELEELQLN